MTNKIKVILKEGKEVSLAEWQKLYGLTVYSNYIGKYFQFTESRFENDLTAFGELIVNEQLMRVLDGLREALGKPVIINSFNRSEEHQKDLKEKGFKAATYSPHVVKLAADIETKDAKQTREWVKYIKQVADILKIEVRIGYEQYLKAGSTFIHVDVCPEYYAPGKPWHYAFHPKQWEKKSTW